MHADDLRVARSADRAGGLAVGMGVPLADVYLEFLGGRCRPNTLLAWAQIGELLNTTAATAARRYRNKP